MKIETLKLNTDQKRNSYFDTLKNLKQGEMIRLKTAQEWRNMNGVMYKASKVLKVTFKSVNDGDSDVLVFIKDEKPKKTS